MTIRDFFYELVMISVTETVLRVKRYGTNNLGFQYEITLNGCHYVVLKDVNVLDKWMVQRVRNFKVYTPVGAPVGLLAFIQINKK